jgi:hypothetical protein
LYSPKCYFSQIDGPKFEKAVATLERSGFKNITDRIYIYNVYPEKASSKSVTFADETPQNQCLKLSTFTDIKENIKQIIQKEPRIRNDPRSVFAQLWDILDELTNKFEDTFNPCLSYKNLKRLNEFINRMPAQDPLDTPTQAELRRYLKRLLQQFKEELSVKEETFLEKFAIDSAREAHELFQTIVLEAPIPHYPMIVGISKLGRVVEYEGPINAEALRNFFLALSQV